jgi:hypothetical protein
VYDAKLSHEMDTRMHFANQLMRDSLQRAHDVASGHVPLVSECAAPSRTGPPPPAATPARPSTRRRPTRSAPD